MGGRSHGRAPLGWRYELGSSAPGETEVTLIYDWTGTSEENMLRYGVPLFDQGQLAASLDQLAAAVIVS